MAAENEYKNVVAPVKSYDGKKTWWHKCGIAGMKDGKIWIRISSQPTQWDGYAILVDQGETPDGNHEKKGESKARKPAGRNAEPPGPDEAGSGEDIPF